MKSLDYLREVTVGEPKKHGGPIALSEYDPRWPSLFQLEAEKIRCALGDAAIEVEHVGSTSVPGLAAKPIIDILLTVEAPNDEAAYAGKLALAGYELRIRERDWYEHRMFKGNDPDVNLHVFAGGCSEARRMLEFRNMLRENPEYRGIYEREKRKLAYREWEYVQDYADTKTLVISQIMSMANRG